MIVCTFRNGHLGFDLQETCPSSLTLLSSALSQQCRAFDCDKLKVQEYKHFQDQKLCKSFKKEYEL